MNPYDLSTSTYKFVSIFVVAIVTFLRMRVTMEANNVVETSGNWQ